MIKLGFLDESKGARNTFYRVFHKQFEVVMLDDPTKIATLDMLLEEIEKQEIQVLAVDYKLADGGWISYNGNDVVDALWEKRRYFPVFMLTSHVGDAIQKMENAFLVNDKDIFSKDADLQVLFQKIEGSVQSYTQILSEKENRVEELEIKQESKEGLNEDEEQELLSLHVEMHAIDPKANPITPDKMQTKAITDLRDLLTVSRAMLDTLKS